MCHYVGYCHSSSSVDGVTVGELTDTAKLIIGLGTALTLLIAGLRKLLQKKDTDKK